MSQEESGSAPAGIPWGPFTLRIPFVHFRAEWPELIQGLIVAGATGLALIPIMTNYFLLSFDVALAVVVVQSILISLAPLAFGDPYCHGWVTPSIPLVLAMIGGLVGESGVTSDNVMLVIHAVTAFTFLNAAMFLVMGISGLGKIVVERTPIALKAGIIFGASLAAFLQEFHSDKSYFYRAPYSCGIAMSICLLLMFSEPINRLKQKKRWVAILAGLGLAPGFAMAFVYAWFSQEVTWDIQTGFQVPPFGLMWKQLSPFSKAVGFPEWGLYLTMLPISLIVYILAFGDMITGDALIKDAAKYRPDEKIDLNPTRTHLNMGIRNAIQGILAGPFPTTHGCLWTGVQVVVTHRYKQGKDSMESIFGGIGAYYLWGLPFLFFLKPVTSLLAPMLPIALSLTILLTGYACGYISMAMTKNPVERGVMMATGAALALLGAWQAIVIGIVMTITLIGPDAFKVSKDKTDGS
jgi:hypothetical protein